MDNELRETQRGEELLYCKIELRQDLVHVDPVRYEAFLARIKLNPLARRVKLADIEDNMDLRWLPVLSEAAGRSASSRGAKAWPGPQECRRGAGSLRSSSSRDSSEETSRSISSGGGSKECAAEFCACAGRAGPRKQWPAALGSRELLLLALAKELARGPQAGESG